MRQTMFEENLWKRTLERYPELKKVAIKAGVENEPKKAEEIKQKVSRSMGSKEISEIEIELAIVLASVEIEEQYSLFV